MSIPQNHYTVMSWGSGDYIYIGGGFKDLELSVNYQQGRDIILEIAPISMTPFVFVAFSILLFLALYLILLVV